MISKPLPEFYMITGKYTDQSDFQNKLIGALQAGDKVVQLRNKHITDAQEYIALANIAQAVCEKYDATLLLATTVDIFRQTSADGLHLNSQDLFQYAERPVATEYLLSVSCHNPEEMQQARKLGADILLLSPVKETSSHPGVPGIGWAKFQDMIRQFNCPVYALGGMQTSDLPEAKQAGAMGIAAISSFWPSS